MCNCGARTRRRDEDWVKAFRAFVDQETNGAGYQTSEEFKRLLALFNQRRAA